MAEKKTTLDKLSQKSVFGIVSTALLAVYAFLLIFPLCWALVTAMKERLDFRANPMGLPAVWYPENFLIAFQKAFVIVDTEKWGRHAAYLPEMFLWSLIFAIGTTIVNVGSRCCTAYIMAKYKKYWLPALMHNVIIVLLIVPDVGNLGSSLLIYRAVGIYDNMAMWMLFACGFTGSNTLIMYASFRGVSWGYAEAALIDGANNYTIMFRIMIPMIKPVILGLMLLQFKAWWNDYSAPMIYLPSYPVVAYGLFKFQNSNDNAVSIPVQMAASVMVATPIVLLYIIFRDQLVGNMSIGGIKG